MGRVWPGRALEKLQESGELEQFKRRHAEYYRDLFERAEAEWETRPTAEWLAAYGREIDNVRAALDWAFSPDGDTAVWYWPHHGLGAALVSVVIDGRMSRARRARALQSRVWIKPGPTPRHETVCRTGRVAAVYQRSGAGDRRGLDERTYCRAPCRHRISITGALGALGLSSARRRVPVCAGAGTTFLRPRCDSARLRRFARLGSNDGHVAALPGRPAGRAGLP